MNSYEEQQIIRFGFLPPDRQREQLGGLLAQRETQEQKLLRKIYNGQYKDKRTDHGPC